MPWDLILRAVAEGVHLAADVYVTFKEKGVDAARAHAAEVVDALAVQRAAARGEKAAWRAANDREAATFPVTAPEPTT